MPTTPLSQNIAEARIRESLRVARAALKQASAHLSTLGRGAARGVWLDCPLAASWSMAKDALYRLRARRREIDALLLNGPLKPVRRAEGFAPAKRVQRTLERLALGAYPWRLAVDAYVRARNAP